MRKSVYMVVIACLASALVACGDDEETAAAQSPPAGGTGNQAPTVSGAPPSQVLQNQPYSFTPTASDPNGDRLTFSVQNLPAWATFNASTGQLSGTPSAAQVGSYSNILISVSDGAMTVNLPAFAIAVVATATGSAMLSWNPPTTNVDGTPLTLTGYKIYWGTSPGSYSNSVTIGAGLSSYVVSQLTPATWYFAATALSATGESAYSNIATKVIR